jgi:hypothetical protein
MDLGTNPPPFARHLVVVVLPELVVVFRWWSSSLAFYTWLL